MVEGLEVCLAECDEQILEVLPLKLANDHEKYGPHRSISEEEALTKIISMHELHYEFWLAVLHGAVIGYALGYLDDNGIYRSDGIYVMPEHRERGIGTRLKQAQIDFAQYMGYRAISTFVATDNVASLRVQEKSGFTLLNTGNGYHCTLPLE